jgi:hypothetical protein
MIHSSLNNDEAPPEEGDPLTGEGAGFTPTSLDASQQALVEEALIQFRSADHYEILEVARDADERAIRRAFVDRVERFQPILFSGRLGRFEPKLKEIFSRIKLAYATLSSEEKRRAYDESLRAKGG